RGTANDGRRGIAAILAAARLRPAGRDPFGDLVIVGLGRREFDRAQVRLRHLRWLGWRVGRVGLGDAARGDLPVAGLLLVAARRARTSGESLLDEAGRAGRRLHHAGEAVGPEDKGVAGL